MVSPHAKLKPPAFGIAAAGVSAAVLSSFLFGYSICVVDSCLGLIAVVFEWCGNEWQSDCNASQQNQGIVNALIYLGAAMGAFATGRSGISKLGSRLQLVLSDAFFFAGAVLCVAAQGVVTLALGRLVSGIGLGLSAVAAPVYIAEVSPNERRGNYAAMNGVLITVGILASIAIGIPQNPPPSGPQQRLQGLDIWFWRFLLGLPAAVALLQVVLLCIVCRVDPPALLLLQGRRDDARRLLFRIYGVELTAKPMDMSNSQQAMLELRLNELEETIATAKTAPRIHVRQAIKDPFFKFPLLLGFGLAAFQQLCGVNSLMSYSNSLFSQAGIQPENLTFASTAMATANVAVSVFSSRVADSWGRKALLLLGAAGQTLAMLLLTILLGNMELLGPAVTGPVAVLCFIVFVTSFSVGLGAITWLYLSEIYPMEIRSAALSTCGVINWLSCFIVVFGGRFLSLKSSCMLFGLISALGWVATYIWIVETKGCAMEDSPLTPRSRRSESPLLSPSASYAKMPEVEDEEDEDGEADMSLNPRVVA